MPHYKRSELNKLPPIEFAKILGELIKMVKSGAPMSIFEAECGCMTLKGRTENGAEDLERYPACQTFLFQYYYRIHQRRALRHPYQDEFKNPISDNEHKFSEKILEKAYQDFLLEVKVNSKGGDKLIIYVANETTRYINIIRKYCAQMGTSRDAEDAAIKRIVLHGKIIYHKAQEYYEELGAEKEFLKIDGIEIVIDAFVFVHTLYRHFAQYLKEFQTGKTYHHDPNIPHDNLPNVVKFILAEYEKVSSRPTVFVERNTSIDFKIGGKPYALWLQVKTKGDGSGHQYLRAESIYPIELGRDLKRIASKSEIAVSKHLSFLI